ncbi:hypothetical protein [Granulicella arctica]|uniref:hypothetical protein n=1 Tax=Granulicella arctica TaxID=940613 RepID=UPI0021DFFFB6|nr:hypothetical protein [Granulicella arctica]
MRRLFCLFLLLAIPDLLLAQSSKDAWSSVMALQVGQKVQVLDIGAKKHNGTVAAVSDDAISLRFSSGDQSVRRQDVRYVKLMENKHRLRNTLIGTGIGGGAGAAILAAAWESNGFVKGKGTGAAVGLALGAIVGAAVGVSLPSHGTIYATP